jgi:hypothetical protein
VRYFCVLTLRAGKICRMQNVYDRDEALRLGGLGP